MGLPRKRAVARVGLQRTELVRPDICMATTIVSETAAIAIDNDLCAVFRSIPKAQADLESLGSLFISTPFTGISGLGDRN